MGYRESPPPATLRDLVECAWVGASSGPAIQVLPDGCMDLIRMDDHIVVADASFSSIWVANYLAAPFGSAGSVDASCSNAARELRWRRAG